MCQGCEIISWTMKTLKFKPDVVQGIVNGDVRATWRLNDDKNLTVDDRLQLIDTSTMEAFGEGLVDEVVIKRLGALNEADKAGHGTYETPEQMYETFRQYYGPGVSEKSVVKIVRFSFTPFDQPKHPEIDAKNTLEFPDIKIYTDGGSRGNPGPSAAGWVVFNAHNDATIEEGGEYLGITTNNQAEYQAVKHALETAQRLGARRIDIYMDSLLVVNQMKGVFKVRNRDLWPIHDAIKQLIGSFESVSFTHVPRELNKIADAKVNEILDAHQ